MYGLTLRVALVFVLLLVLLVSTIALGMVRLGFACATTVLALLDGTTLWIDVVQFAIYDVRLDHHSACHRPVTRHTSVGATAHSMALDAGRASPFFAIDDRHTAVDTAGCDRRRWLKTGERECFVEPTG